jgi:chromate transport protein ChrA
MTNTEQHVRTGGDILSAGGLVATLMGYLPAIAAVVTITWTAMRITEMVTGEPFHKTRVAQAVRCFFRRIFPKRGDHA